MACTAAMAFSRSVSGLPIVSLEQCRMLRVSLVDHLECRKARRLHVRYRLSRVMLGMDDRREAPHCLGLSTRASHPRLRYLLKPWRAHRSHISFSQQTNTMTLSMWAWVPWLPQILSCGVSSTWFVPTCSTCFTNRATRVRPNFVMTRIHFGACHQ